MAFPWVRQHDTMQCGAACLTIVCRYYGATYPLLFIDSLCDTSAQGVSLHTLNMVAKELGFTTMTVKTELSKLAIIDYPTIIHWEQRHFVVLYKVSPNRKYFYISDPGKGRVRLSKEEFMQGWIGETYQDSQSKGIALILEPSSDFKTIYYSNSKSFGEIKSKITLQFFSKLKDYHKELFQIGSGMFLGIIFQTLFPFLTQAVVDKGIFKGNLNIIYLILAGECIIILASALTDFIRRWLLLHISMRINVALISDFIDKLFRLPMKFFDTRHLGDFIQRMEDNKRIQSFMTSEFLNFSFTSLSILVFGTILAFYDLFLFGIFLIFSLGYAGWICLFLRRRKTIDYELFAAEGENQNCTYQLLSTMQETKLQGCETKRRWEWEDAQAGLFDVKVKSLKLQQLQESGTVCINELKNILITVFAASAVIKGRLTIGEMLAIQFIIGQLNNPVAQIVNFIYSLQDLRISFERVNEIKKMQDEENSDSTSIIDGVISFRNVRFRYDRFSPDDILQNINIDFEKGKVTAIVGSSGSGKTTLIKLLLGYYSPTSGDIKIGGKPLKGLSIRNWRSKCGVVMQEGEIYNDTIAGNIVMGDGSIDYARLENAMSIAGIDKYIQSLPMKSATKIGRNGKGLSLGQKQRILIARAIYKNPDIIIFDEATNSLDAINERKIVDNLEQFFRNKTVIIIAHRLSTVKNADKILVMENGNIIEQGTYNELIQQNGSFYTLVKNQLDQ